jgi:hypothetical protein
MKKLYAFLMLALCFGWVSCSNPLNGIKLYITNNLYQYTVTVYLQDATNAKSGNLTGAQISVGGQDAAYVFDRDGNTKFTPSSGGAVDFSINPTDSPTPSKPLVFDVNISCSGYVPVTKRVVITSSNAHTAYTVRMVNIASPPGGVTVGQRSLGLTSGGGVQKPAYAGSKSTAGGSNADSLGHYYTAIYLPVGTTFYYYTTPAGICGTRVSPLTTDSTAITGLNSIIYRPVSGYYQTEAAQFASGLYTPTAYTGTTLSVITVFRNDTTYYPYSVYPYTSSTGTTNSISTLYSGTGNAESKLVLKSCIIHRLVDFYFVGKVNGKDIVVSPYSTPTPTGETWYVSYRIDANKLAGAVAAHPSFVSGDSIETGINYSYGNYPIVPYGGSFTASNLTTQKSVIITDSFGNLRVNCQSLDAGVYLGGISYDYSYSLKASVDSNQIPDIENLFAIANITMSVGGTTSHLGQTVTPNKDLNLSGTFTSINGSSPSFSGNVNIYYWDSCIRNIPTITDGMQVFTGFPTGTKYSALASGDGVMFDQIVAFHYDFECSAKGSDKIIEPTYNGTFSAYSNGVFSKTNCNMKSGTWKTRGVKVGTLPNPDTITGTACSKAFTPIIVTSIYSSNTQTFNDPVICNCYFH